MIEETILNHLSGRLTFPVYMETPEVLPEKYVLIEKTGSYNENFIITSTFAIQSISRKRLRDAARMNELVIEAMKDLILDNTVTRCKLDSDYNFTDTEKKAYRYQAVFDITHY